MSEFGLGDCMAPEAPTMPRGLVLVKVCRNTFAAVFAPQSYRKYGILIIKTQLKSINKPAPRKEPLEHTDFSRFQERSTRYSGILPKFGRVGREGRGVADTGSCRMRLKKNINGAGRKEPLDQSSGGGGQCFVGCHGEPGVPLCVSSHNKQIANWY